MALKKVQVKWKKEKFDVEVDMHDKPSVFKAQLFALSGVLPERQKIMMKGKTLKEDNWENFMLRDGATLLLMGSEGGTIDIDKPLLDKPVIFEEDVTDDTLAKIYDLPAGLVNLGNTCYMNATLQCFYAIPVLRKSVVNYTTSKRLPSAPAIIAQDQNETFILALKQLFVKMNENPTDLVPFLFLQILHQLVPEFAEKDEHGGYRQQDANECLIRIRNFMREKLAADPTPSLKQPSLASTASNATQLSQPISLIDKYFAGQFLVNIKSDEDPSEPAVETEETFYQLRCFINTDVKYLQTGILHGLKEKIEKFSQKLGHNATYTKTCQISRLPAYLTIQFERFFYKKDQGINAKIRKEVKFPLMLDTYELCTPALRERLVPQRQKFKDSEEKKVEDSIEGVTKSVMAEGAHKSDDTNNATGKKQDPSLNNSVELNEAASYSFPDDVGSNNSGFYDLIAVLTHQGRTSDSGHYVAWIKRNGNWMMCDDNSIKQVSEENILKLCGGGDWHTAYVLVYGPRLLKPEDTSSAQKTDAPR